MSSFFRADFVGEGPGLFSVDHLAILVIVAIASITISWSMRKVSEEKKWRFLRILSIVYVLNFVGRQTWLLATGIWDAAIVLPLHLCSYMLIFIPHAVFTRSPSSIHITYAIGLPGALMALLFPADWINDFPLTVYRSLETISSHSLIAFFPLFMILSGLVTIEFRRIKEVFLVLLAMLGISLIANLIIGNGANYMFVIHAPEIFPFNAIEAAVGYGYLVVYVALLVLLWVLLFLPFYKKPSSLKKEGLPQ